MEGTIVFFYPRKKFSLGFPPVKLDTIRGKLVETTREQLFPPVIKESKITPLKNSFRLRKI